MKQKYTKPSLHVEHFALTQNIALSCGWTDEKFIGHPTHAEKATCGWFDGFGDIIWASVPPCTDEYPTDLVIGEVCYNTPNGQPQIFAS